jgi:SAM-dependent methyltransferase
MLAWPPSALPGEGAAGDSVANMDNAMRWQTRCAIDRMKGMVGGEEFLRRVKRGLCGFRADLGRDRGAIEEGLTQLEWVQSAIGLEGIRVLEIGSGWQPLIPILFSLAGAREVIATDVKRLCHPVTLSATIESLLLCKAMICERLNIPEAAFARLEESVPAGETLEKRLARFSIRYMAPCDVRRTGMADGSVDAIVSRATLEHIPPDILRDILTESARILRPGGVMCHVVDNSDHWQHNDKRITPVNFLKFSDRTFGCIQWNGLNYQNRLRHPQYTEMIREAALRIRREERVVDEESLRALEQMTVAPRFRAFSREDLATVTSYLLAEK